MVREFLFTNPVQWRNGRVSSYGRGDHSFRGPDQNYKNMIVYAIYSGLTHYDFKSHT